MEKSKRTCLLGVPAAAALRAATPRWQGAFGGSVLPSGRPPVPAGAVRLLGAARTIRILEFEQSLADQRAEVTLRQAGLVHVQPARQLLGRGPIPPVADFQDQGMQDVTRRAPLEDGGADLREQDGRDALEACFEVRFGGDGRGRVGRRRRGCGRTGIGVRRRRRALAGIGRRFGRGVLAGIRRRFRRGVRRSRRDRLPGSLRRRVRLGNGGGGFGRRADRGRRAGWRRVASSGCSSAGPSSGLGSGFGTSDGTGSGLGGCLGGSGGGGRFGRGFESHQKSE